MPPGGSGAYPRGSAPRGAAHPSGGQPNGYGPGYDYQRTHGAPREPRPGYGPLRAPRQPGPFDPPEEEALPLTGPGRQIRSHGRRQRRVPLWTVLLLILGLGAVGAGLRFVPGSPFAPTGSTAGAAGAGEPMVTTTPPPEPLPFRSAPVTITSVDTKGFLSWALLDRRSGEIVGSANLTATSTTASMIKAWLASDYLRRAAEKGEEPTASRLKDLEVMIRDSDNNAADRTYNATGKTASINRLISICKLTDSKAISGFWSNTNISARDTVRMGACIADGRAAGSRWTPWVLDMMRKVRDVGDFGIRKALPEAGQGQVAIKNGWLLRDEDNNWHTNCLAIGDTWVLAVLQRYPSQGNWNDDFAHTQQVCTTVAQQLLNPDAS
ncbi:MAG TPA: hypothetical protein VF163_11650 [Micromonosporaceae bacterium]